MTIKRIDIISIPVSDQVRSKAFYVDKLGFTVKRDNPMGPGQRWVELATAFADPDGNGWVLQQAAPEA